MIAEYFAARRDEVDEEVVELGPEGRLELVSANAQSPVTIANLGVILGVGDYDELIAQDTEWEGQSNECAIFAIPTGTRDALAEATDLEQVARQWTATDDMRLDGWTVEETREVLTGLVNLAAAARASGRELWFYWSL